MAAAAAVILSPGALRADLVGGAFVTTNSLTSWSTNVSGGISPQYTSISSSSLGTATTGQGQATPSGGATFVVTSEIFTPIVPFTLTGVGILESCNSAVSGASMHLFDITTNLNPQTGGLNAGGTTYSNMVTDLLGNGSGLTFNAASSGEQQIYFGLTNGPTSNDRIPVTTNHTYALEFWIPAASAPNNFIWYRNGGSPPDPGGMAMGSPNASLGTPRQTLASLGQAGAAPRIFSMALYSTNFVVLGATTNIVATLNNPVPAVYGPPTSWPYFSGVQVPTDATATNKDYTFGANAVMGETFTANRTFNLRNYYFALRGTATSGNYVLVLNDLGTGSTTTYGSSFNPAPYTSANLLSHPGGFFPQYWSFSPTGLTNTTIVKFKFSGNDAITLTNGHSYFLGFANASGNNDMVLEGTSTSQTYAGGAAYAGSITSVANNGFGASDRNLMMAVDVLNPNLVVGVQNSALGGSWPTLSGYANSGVPYIQTTTSPSGAEGSGNGVEEGVESGRSISMSFIATNNFNLGAIALASEGLGSSNCLFTIAVYDVTNNFFSQGPTGSINKWPVNMQPNIDTAPKGVPIFGTNLDFYYTAANGVNGAGNGTNDQVLLLTIPQPYQTTLVSNHVYAVEISADVFGQNANSAGLFQWVRDVGQFEYQIDLFPDLGDGIQMEGYRTNAASANAATFITPRALSRVFTDPETFAGQVAGGPRDFVMAVYAAPPIINISSITRTGNSVVLNWNSTGGTYSVNTTTNLQSSWTQLATGLANAAYTNTPVTGSIRFYQVTSP